MKKEQRVRQLNTRVAVALVTASVTIAGTIGYGFGTGKFKLPEQNPCQGTRCTHYTRELFGGAMVYEKDICCLTHGHDCDSY